MATTITITCPYCDKQIKAPVDLLGKKMRCKGCGEAFKAEAEDDEEEARPSRPKPPAGKKAAPGKPPPGKKAPAKGKGGQGDDDKDDVNPYGVTHLELGARCPYCANAMESDDAIICLTCGYNTRTRERARKRRVRDHTGMDTFLWLLPGIACVIGILVVLGLFIWYCVGFVPDPDPLKNEWYDFWKHFTCKIWVGVFGAFALFYMGRFSIRRLIKENTPPEVEEEERRK
jgi:hypothetical protein